MAHVGGKDTSIPRPNLIFMQYLCNSPVSSEGTPRVSTGRASRAERNIRHTNNIDVGTCASRAVVGVAEPKGAAKQ